MIAIADTSGLVALFNRADPEHEAVSAAANRCGLLVVGALALTEVHQIVSIRANRAAADRVIATIAHKVEAERIEIAATTSYALAQSVAVRGKYEALDLDFADASVVVLAAQYRTDVVLTLDRRDFRMLRPLYGYDVFRLLPDDL